MGWLLNWSRDQMRKERDKERIIHEGMACVDLALINVYDIGQFLESIERNSWRKEYPEGCNLHLDPHGSERYLESIGEEVKIFEKSQEEQVYGDR
jgi:hypothetical protein